jgi:predicted transcriptional regulator
MTHELIKIYDYVKRNPGRSSSDISLRFNVLHLKARNDLKQLEKYRMLKSKKVGGVYYFY